MLDDVFKESAAPEDEVPPSGSPRHRSPLLAPAVLVPTAFLLLVGLTVTLFGLLSFDRKSPFDLLREVRTSSGEKRVLAAYELSRLLSLDLPEANRRKEFVALALDTFHREAGGDPDVRRSLALTLGRLGDPLAVPELIRSLGDSDVETQLYAVWALGAIGDRRAVDPIISKLEHDDPGVRKMACFALGQIGDARAIPALQSALQDTAADVTWNAAVALARLGDRSGSAVLLSLLDRKRSGIASLSPARQEEVMVSVVRSLRGTGDAEMTRVLRRLAQEDASPRIRDEAQRALGKGVSRRPAPIH
jgi:HEAT repeat protein